MSLFDKILVPLDGSATSEQVLIQAGRLLGAPGARVRLLSAIDRAPFRGTLRPFRGARDDELVNDRLADRRAYLRRIQERLSAQGVAASIAVTLGVPAAAILDEAGSFGATLVAMNTHGRSGLSKWAFGSVAQRVLRHCPAPLLLVKPQPAGPCELAFERVLVALDGSPRSARIVPLVQDLALRAAAEVVLFSACWAERVDADPTYRREMGEVREVLREALREPLEQLRAAGLSARAVVEDGPPADAIVAALAEARAGLLALTTHGRTGLDRFLLGSVAERTLQSSPVPLLLLRTPGD